MREGAQSPILVLLGAGYVARALADSWPGESFGTTRDPAKATAGAGRLVAFDGRSAQAPLRALLWRATHVLDSIPPASEDHPAPGLNALGLDSSVAPNLQWVGYLSTTGVYGDRGGGWAFEDETPTPSSTRARRRVAAEAVWLASPWPAHVFRLPGIYGPGRSALDRVRAGDAHRAVKPGLVFNRAHVQDIAGALQASIATPKPGAIYNVCDDAPAPPQDVTLEACRLLDVEPPPEVTLDEAALSPMGREFYAESKRCSNAKLKAETGWRPAFPTYREGLAAILAAGG